MREFNLGPFLLLGYFADFYEEVASIKLALSEGRLSAYLAVGGETPPVQGAELASRISSRLEKILRQQTSDIRRRGSAEEIRLHSIAQYLMAAITDEIFILELDWTGRNEWLDYLLEHKLFGSHNAGRRFFSLADQLLAVRQREPLHVDLASVFLLALQLGFKGMYRGNAQHATLLRYRQQLYKLSSDSKDDDDSRPAFSQAYQYNMSGASDARLAPLSRWYTIGYIALALYLVVSIILWVKVTYPFEQAFG